MTFTRARSMKSVAGMTVEGVAENLFDVANHFNRGATLLVDRDEKVRVATIELQAGRRAKASTAYASACVYLAAGIALLEEPDWGIHYALTFSLWLECAECEFLTGHFDKAEQPIGVIAARSVERRPSVRPSSQSAIAYREVGKPAGRGQRNHLPAPFRHRHPAPPDLGACPDRI